ncbi:MAG TPA: histidinol dehydrogenase [Terriglobales bacterium]|jgi:histidinol dehydrogenase|nr:histidinol dehydrogenase [Terriglobales bacterium]
MRILRGQAAEETVARLAGRAHTVSREERSARRIIAHVRREGDHALRNYARKWEELGTKPLRVTTAEMRAASKSVSSELMSSIRLAANNIRRFAERQKPIEWKRTTNGLTVGQLVRPLESVGCYVPGGRHPLISTLLMTTIPAIVAGVPRICVVSPNPPPELLAVAHELGIGELYRVGGAQAIAALAYGTESISRVDKIVGPGNSYVTAAKRTVAFDCSIDMLAGPTEVVIVQHDGEACWIASDLVAQAEHDPDALAILITCSAKLAKAVSESASKLSQGNAIARESLRKNGYILIAPDRSQAMAWANRLAPEHITVSEQDVDEVRNAGSIFVGEYSPQAAGDYVSGPNHVLPTGGAARFRGGLTVHDLVKLITVQQLSPSALRRVAPAITALAEAEGLGAHANSVRVRCSHA